MRKSHKSQGSREFPASIPPGKLQSHTLPSRIKWLLAVGVWLIIWQLVSMAFRWRWPHGHLLLASPLEAAFRLGTLFHDRKFWLAVGSSSLRISGGFCLACTLAVGLACLSAWKNWIRILLAPLIAVIKATPVVSFIILALVWLDGKTLPLCIAALMVLPPVYLNVLEGITQTNPKLLEMARVFRVPFLRRIWGIYLPQVLPYFRSAASLGLGVCWKSGVAAEVIALTSGSIGERLYMAKVYFETADLFAWTAVILVISWGFERVFLGLLDTLLRKFGL